MKLTGEFTRRFRSASWTGLVFAAFWLWAVAPAGAEEQAQEEQAVRLSIGTSLLEVGAVNQSDEVRLISVRLDDKSLAEFKTDPGMTLDLMATYSGAGATYLVLRTNLSQGGCGGTDVYVLTAYPEGEGGPHVEVSPILQKCMGEVPGVCFIYDEREGEIVSVAGFELRDDKWVQPAEDGAAQQ